MVTAGHCLTDGAGHWSSKVLFVPAYLNGAGPYGVFPAKVLWAQAGWINGADSSYDVGIFSVGKNGAGRTLQASVGALGFAADQSRVQHWDAFGYPAGSPFNGETMQVCEASHAYDDAAVGGGADTIGIGCDMTGGSSGGPWIIALRRGSYINGLNSYGYDAEPGAMYSPYFSSDTNALRCSAATGDPLALTC